MTDALLVRLDLRSSVAIYEQIANGIRTHLVSGRLRPGASLPPVRDLALNLGVHHNTVAEAYRLLAREGWLDLRRKRGAVVCDREAPRADPASEAKFAQGLSELTAKALTDGLSGTAAARHLERLAAQLRKD
ncbi:MAG TPA: GntR family transcriptional regulator [Vicinamibacterales bacterium]|nr:GntR family transcriptional regulator [Vicinamibacterales bacterium]